VAAHEAIVQRIRNTGDRVQVQPAEAIATGRRYTQRGLSVPETHPVDPTVSQRDVLSATITEAVTRAIAQRVGDFEDSLARTAAAIGAASHRVEALDVRLSDATDASRESMSRARTIETLMAEAVQNLAAVEATLSASITRKVVRAISAGMGTRAEAIGKTRRLAYKLGGQKRGFGFVAMGKKTGKED